MILIDTLRKWNRTKLYCHMVSTDSLSELHAFAKRIGIKRHWYENGHYDLREQERAIAIAAGANEVSSREIVHYRNMLTGSKNVS